MKANEYVPGQGLVLLLGRDWSLGGVKCTWFCVLILPIHPKAPSHFTSTITFYALCQPPLSKCMTGITFTLCAPGPKSFHHCKLSTDIVDLTIEIEEQIQISRSAFFSPCS